MRGVIADRPQAKLAEQVEVDVGFGAHKPIGGSKSTHELSFPCPSRSRLGSFGEKVDRYILPWVRFAAAGEIGFVSSRRYILPWVRFAAAREIGFVSSRRYILPWVRFVGGRRNWVRFAEASQIAVGSFRRWRLVRSGKPRGVTSCRGFVSRGVLSGFLRGMRPTLGATGSPNPCRTGRCETGSPDRSRKKGSCHRQTLPALRKMPWVRFAHGSRKWVRFVKALQIAVGSFCSRARGAPRMATAVPARVRRTRGTRNLAPEPILLPGFARMPWVRFAEALHLAVGSFRRWRLVRSGKPRGVTSCRGFVSSASSVGLVNRATTVGSAEVCQIAKDREGAVGGFLEPYYRASNVVVPVPLEDRAGRWG